MAEDKKSFLLYADLIHTVRKMPTQKAGELFLTILSYVNDESPKVDDVVVDLVFEPIKQQLKRDLKRWESFRHKQSENGKKGGRPMKPTPAEETQKTQAFFGKPKEPKPSLNATATATVTDNKLSSEKIYELMRSNTNRGQISDNRITEQVNVFMVKYQDATIGNLTALINKWVQNIQPDIQEKKMVL